MIQTQHGATPARRHSAKPWNAWAWPAAGCACPTTNGLVRVPAGSNPSAMSTAVTPRSSFSAAPAGNWNYVALSERSVRRASTWTESSPKPPLGALPLPAAIGQTAAEHGEAGATSLRPAIYRRAEAYGSSAPLRRTDASRCGPNEKAQAPGRTDRMPSHLCLAHYGPGLMGYQTGACIVRQAQEQAGPEYTRPGTASSKPAVTPAALKVHNNVRWGKPDMGFETQSARGPATRRSVGGAWH